PCGPDGLEPWVRAERAHHSMRGGPGCLNRFSASISGASARVRLPSGVAAGWRVGLLGRGAVKARVGTSAIIKVQVTADRSASLGYTFVGPQIHFLVFDAAPYTLDDKLSRHAPLPSTL